MPATLAKPTPWYPGINLEHIQARGLVGAWLMNEGAGSLTRDVSGNNNHATLTNMDPKSAWVGSDRGFVLDFDGTDDYVNVPNSPVFDSVVGTWMIWVKSRTTPSATFDPIMVRHDASSSRSGITLTLNSGNAIRMQIKNGAATIVADIAAGSLSQGQWHHVAMSWAQASGGPIELYVDGVSVGSDTNSAAWTFNSQDIRFGDAPDTFWDEWDGQFDDARAYNKILSPAEIQAVYLDPYALYREPEMVHLFSAGVTAPVGGIVVLRRRIEAA